MPLSNLLKKIEVIRKYLVQRLNFIKLNICSSTLYKKNNPLKLHEYPTAQDPHPLTSIFYIESQLLNF